MGNESYIKKNYISYVNKIIKNNKVSHSYLFEIDDYEKDSFYIYAFIKMILCNLTYEDILDSDNRIISLIDQSNYPDIVVIEPDGNWIKKSQLISLQKEYSNKSLLGNKRIYIIKNVEKLNPSSANTMLKFLEEPENDIIAMLVTDNRYHVIDTILSRCQILTLKENDFSYSLEDNDLNLLKVVVNPRSFFIKYHDFVDNILIDKVVAQSMFKNIENIIISYINGKYCENFEIDNKIVDILNMVDDMNLLYILRLFEEELIKIKYNVNYKLWLDSLFSKIIIGG